MYTTIRIETTIPGGISTGTGFFFTFCETCKYRDLAEWEDPCNACIEEGMREETVKSIHHATQSIEEEIGKVIIGKTDVIRKVLMSILANGHILLDDVPGVGKTSLAVALGKTLGLEYNRIQCTPDVLPSDIVGFSVFNKEKDAFTYMPGIINNTNLANDTAEEALEKGSDGEYRSNTSRKLRRNLSRSMRYYGFAPIETASSFLGKLGKSLKEMDE